MSKPADTTPCPRCGGPPASARKPTPRSNSRTIWCGARLRSSAVRGNQLPDLETSATSPLLSTMAHGELIVACELPPPVGAEVERAVADAELLRVAGCQYIVGGLAVIATTCIDIASASAAMPSRSRSRSIIARRTSANRAGTSLRRAGK